MSEDTTEIPPDEGGPSETATDLLVEAALTMAGEEGWRAVSVRAAGERAGIDPITARRTVRCKAGLLAAIADRVDAGMREALDEDATDPSIPVRDRLFEALMARLDVLTERRAAYVSILEGLPRDPATALATLPSLGRSMARTLDAVGERTLPPFGPLKVKGLALVWLATLRTWMTDESPDMAATMKALDGYLARAEEAANTLFPGGQRTRSAQDGETGSREAGSAV
jgi:AcrR family transcriptional regulator